MAYKTKTHVLHSTDLFTQYRPRDSFMTSAAKKVYSWQLSSAVRRRQKLAQLGDDVAPKRCTIIWYSTGSLFKSLFGHQRNQRVSQSSGLPCTWWNIDSMSAIRATGSCWKHVRTSTRLFVRSGPWRSWSLSDVRLCLAAQPKTTRTLPGLFALRTGWWGRYHTAPTGQSNRSPGTLRAWPWWC